MLASTGYSHGGQWWLASNGDSNGLMVAGQQETVMVVAGCWPAMDTAKELMDTGQQWRQQMAGQQGRQQRCWVFLLANSGDSHDDG